MRTGVRVLLEILVVLSLASTPGASAVSLIAAESRASFSPPNHDYFAQGAVAEPTSHVVLDDIDSLYDRLPKSIRPRDEFETTDEYRRFVEGLEVSLGVGRTPYAFLIEPESVWLAYDESRAEWSLRVTWEPGVELSGAAPEPAANGRRTEGSKSAVYRLALRRSPRVVGLPMSRERAHVLEPVLGVVVVGTLERVTETPGVLAARWTQARQSESGREQRIVALNPVRILLVDKSSRAIYAGVDVPPKFDGSEISLRPKPLDVKPAAPTGIEPAPPPPPPPCPFVGPLCARLVKIKHAEYPQMAMAAGAEGSVVVTFSVDAEGRVRDVHALSGHPLLRDAAEMAVTEWEFAPASDSAAETVVVKTNIQFVRHK